MLIPARAGQGLGAALMTPAALSLITTTYSGTQRTRGLALWGIVGSLGIAAGVLFGGDLTTWASWQMIFWINVPIGAIAFCIAVIKLPKQRTTHPRLAQLDLTGGATVVVGLSTLVSHGVRGVRERVGLVDDRRELTGFAEFVEAFDVGVGFFGDPDGEPLTHERGQREGA